MSDHYTRPATLLAHDDLAAFALGEGGPIVPPILQSSLFTFANGTAMETVLAGERH